MLRRKKKQQPLLGNCGHITGVYFICCSLCTEIYYTLAKSDETYGRGQLVPNAQSFLKIGKECVSYVLYYQHQILPISGLFL